MNVIKIITSSVLFPIVHKRETLNAVSLPLAIFTISWGGGVFLIETIPQIGWVSFIIQIFSIAMLLVNCITLAIKPNVCKPPEYFIVYGKVSVLLVAYMIAVFLLQYVITFLSINLFSIETSKNFQLVNSVSQVIANILLFRLFLVIPHYINTGIVGFRQVFVNTQGMVIRLIIISSLYQLFKLVPELFINTFDSTVANYFSALIWFSIQVVWCFIVSLSYLSSLPRVDERNLTSL